MADLLLPPPRSRFSIDYDNMQWYIISSNIANIRFHDYECIFKSDEAFFEHIE